MPNVPREWKSFWAHPMVLLANGGQEEACFDPFGDIVNLIVDRCTVSTECTMCMEIALGTPKWYSEVSMSSGSLF